MPAKPAPAPCTTLAVAVPMPPAAASAGDAAAVPDAPRFVQERQQRIADLLREQGRVEVATLAADYGVSDDTIRRDLRQLAARGLVHKTHGGAMAVHAALLPTLQRVALAPGAKQAIAQHAATLVQAHHTLFIDGGSTTLALVQRLCAADAPRPLTVITHALDVVLALASDPQVQLVLAGGRFLPTHRIFVGAQALATLQGCRADIAFLGACALHPRAGLTAFDAEEALLKRAMVDGAARRVVLGDSSKFDQVAPNAVVGADAVDLVITDADVPWLHGRIAVATGGVSGGGSGGGSGE